MRNLPTNRVSSLSMVVLVLLLTLALQESISYSTSFGRLGAFLPGQLGSYAAGSWLAVRAAALLAVIVLWVGGRKRPLFKAIILANALLTLGLVMNMAALLDRLSALGSEEIGSLIRDVLLMAITNVLIFSIWYWIIDPPGIEETQRLEEPWDFLFPQREGHIPGYEEWSPRYTDYLYLAFTTSVAFSPTDALPLTRRAKMLMLLQAVVSVVTLTAIAGTAINALAGGG